MSFHLLKDSHFEDAICCHDCMLKVSSVCLYTMKLELPLNVLAACAGSRCMYVLKVHLVSMPNITGVT